MSTMNISLTPELERSVRALVEEGRYGNQSEVLRAALRLLLREEDQRKAKLEALRAAVQVGIDEFERGEYITYANPEQLIADVKAVAES
jgi:antitoxin ParD1/3/4